MNDKINHTKGPWSYEIMGMHCNNPELVNIEIHHGEDGECIADTVYEEADAKLIEIAPTAPHSCDDPKCPGNINRQKLEMFEDMIDLFRVIELYFAIGDLRQEKIIGVLTRARALMEAGK